MNEWDGKLRRVDDEPESLRTRVALLEQSTKAAEVRHTENTANLNAIQRRITEMGKDFAAALDKGIDALKDKTDIQTAALVATMTVKYSECQIRETRVTKMENDIKWINRWVGSAWAAIIAGVGLIIHHGAKMK